MHVVEGQENLLDNVGSYPLRDTLALNHFLEKVATGAEFHNDEVVPVILEQLEDSGDVWVVCLLQYLELVPHQLLVYFGLSEHGLLDDFYCNRHLGLKMVAESDGAKRPTAEFLSQLISVCDLSRLPEPSCRLEVEDSLLLALLLSQCFSALLILDTVGSVAFEGLGT